MSTYFRLIGEAKQAHFRLVTSLTARRSTMDANVTATTPFVREPGAGSTLNVLGVTHIYKVTGAETAGSFSLWEDVVPPGAGAPPHVHSREDEAFYVLSGEIQVEFEGERAPRRIGAGGFFYGACH